MTPTILSNPRGASKYQSTMESIQQQFSTGAWMVEIKTDNARRLRKNLYTLMHRRQLRWNFSVSDGSLYVMRSKEML